MTKPANNGTPTANTTVPDPETLRKREEFVEYVANTSLLFRRELFNAIIDPRRNLEEECGYPPSSMSVDAGLYRHLYETDPIANRVVQLMPAEAFQSTPLVYEDESTDDVTDFEEAWDGLSANLSSGSTYHLDESGSAVWEYLKRATTLARIGHFGIIMLGLDDGRNLQEPVDGTVELTSNESGGLTFNRSNPLHGWPDSWCSVEEETQLRNLQPREVWTGNYRRVKTAEGVFVKQPVTERVNPQPLTQNEQHIIDRWSRERVLVENHLKGVKHVGHVGDEPMDRGSGGRGGRASTLLIDSASDLAEGRPRGSAVANDAWGGMSGTPQNPGTDAQYAWQGNPAGSLSGTDQQYFGVQFGPSEVISDTPPKRRKLLFLRVFDESLVQIVRWEWNVRNPRFGQPVMYRVTLNDPRVGHSGVGLPMATVFVHWSRVIHLNDVYGSANPSEVMSTPSLQPVLHPVLDDRKIRGGGAEGYWQSCVPGYAFSTHPTLGGDVAFDERKILDTVENYRNSTQKAMIAAGFNISTLNPTVPDPGPQHEMQLEVICVQLGCPVRVFKGSERGELASAQDDSSWNDRVQAYRDGYLTPRVIVPFIDRLIAVGVLPVPNAKQREDEDEKPAAKPQGQDATGKTIPGLPPKGVPAENTLQRGSGWLIFNGPVRGKRAWFKQMMQTQNAVAVPDNDAQRYGQVPIKTIANPPRQLGNKTPPVPGESPKVIGFMSDAGYHVKWPDLDSTTEAQKAQIALQFTQALAAFVSGGCEAAMQLKDWLVRVWHWTEEEADEVVEGATTAETNLTIPPPGSDGHPATPPPKPPAPIVAPKQGVPPGTPGAPAGGIPAAKPPKPPSAQTGGQKPPSSTTKG